MRHKVRQRMHAEVPLCHNAHVLPLGNGRLRGSALLHLCFEPYLSDFFRQFWLQNYYKKLRYTNKSAVCGKNGTFLVESQKSKARRAANLVFRGNIKHPMDLRALGRVMSAMGYVSKRLGKTRARGFLVIENQVNSSTALALAQKIRAQEMADKADKGQEVF